MAKNHYVSQLIIKRFAPSVTTFDTKAQCIIENRQAHKIFYKEDIYDNAIEKKLAHDLEQPFARLLDEKVLHSEKVILTRDDLFLLKQFLLLDSVRTHEASSFVRILKSFRNNVERYLQLQADGHLKELMKMPSVFDLGLEDRAIQMRAMRLFLECKNTGDLIENEFVTKELYCWAKVNYDSYLTFWDSNDSQEFILTSTGMVSEYEPSHEIFGGLDLSKHSYLSAKMDSDRISVHKAHYAHLLTVNQIMYENFNIFNLSSKRCMVLVHPFFRLYNDFQGVLNGEFIKVGKPDIWPTCFETKKICLPPENRYVMPLFHSAGDEFVYTPQKLSLWDTIYLNALTLQQSPEVLGFNDITKVIDSFVFITLMSSFCDEELDRVKGLNALSRWIDNMLKDKYFYIFKHYKELKPTCLTNPFELLDKYGDLKWKDIKENKYVLEYLLSIEEKVKTMDNFAFMGSPDQRIDAFKYMLRKIKT